MKQFPLRVTAFTTSIFLVPVITSLPLLASSHREAPLITRTPKVDATDIYVFNSYESGREDYVTLIANYIPLQDPYGGPNYFTLDTNALYEIHIDNDGALVDASQFPSEFPYLNLPIKGSPNDPTILITPEVSSQAEGPYQSTSGSFDSQSRRLTVDKPSPLQGFLRLKSEGTVQLTEPQTDQGQWSAKVE